MDDFFGGSNYINTEDNCERLIDFLSQISKLSNFNGLDLADLWCIIRPVTSGVRRNFPRGGKDAMPIQNFQKI